MISFNSRWQRQAESCGGRQALNTSINYYCDKCFEEQLIGDPESD